MSEVKEKNEYAFVPTMVIGFVLEMAKCPELQHLFTVLLLMVLVRLPSIYLITGFKHGASQLLQPQT